jgi:hypothetical protein
MPHPIIGLAHTGGMALEEIIGLTLTMTSGSCLIIESISPFLGGPPGGCTCTFALNLNLTSLIRIAR